MHFKYFTSARINFSELDVRFGLIILNIIVHFYPVDGIFSQQISKFTHHSQFAFPGDTLRILDKSLLGL